MSSGIKRDQDQYSPEETQQRITAAIRGARIVGHKPMNESTKPAKRKRVVRRKAPR
jgi:hypothetical protein